MSLRTKSITVFFLHQLPACYLRQYSYHEIWNCVVNSEFSLSAKRVPWIFLDRRQLPLSLLRPTSHFILVHGICWFPVYLTGLRYNYDTWQTWKRWWLISLPDSLDVKFSRTESTITEERFKVEWGAAWPFSMSIVPSLNI